MFIAFGLFSLTMRPQAAPAVPAGEASGNEPDPSRSDSVIELSPFQVSADSDQGYAARQTLSGTRFKTDLKDVPSQVSVMTKEFLEDIASVTPEDAFRYSLNIENTTEFQSPTAGGGDFNTGVLNTRSMSRIRGLASAGVSHDFFSTTILQDTYNIDRLSITSGPNAILFGNGNPGGIFTTSFIRPNLQRQRYVATVRTDDHGSLRGSVDLNQPLIDRKVGIRLASVRSDENSWRKPGGRKDARYFSTVQIKPFSGTTIRAYYEDSMVDQTTPRNVRFGDYITPWIAAGRPVFDNGLVNPTVINASNNTIFARMTSSRPVWILGAYADNPYIVWGSGANAAITNPATRYSSQTIGPGSQPNQVGIDSYIYSLPENEDLSPYDVSVNGNGTRNLQYGRIAGVSLEQNLPANFFLQIDWNKERVLQPVSDFLRGINSGLLVDANKYLPDRVTPNPNLGRYYVQAQARVFAYRTEKEESRAMLSYEHDFSNRSNWMKWLGRHRLAGMVMRAQSMDMQQEFVPRRIPAGTPEATILDNWAGPMYNTLEVRAYLSDPKNSATGSQYFLQLPFDPLRTTTYTMPDGSTYVGGYKNPYGATNGPTMTNNLNDSQVFVMQNFFWKDRIVTTLGWRRDRIRQASHLMARQTAAPNSAFESMVTYDLPTNWTVYTQGNTSTQGVVFHALPWISAFFNQSSTWNPPTGRFNPDDGSQVAGSTGDGSDYGLMFNLLNNRLSMRIGRYENTSGPDSNTGFRNAIIPVVQNIENTLIDRTDDGTVNVARPKYYDPEVGTYSLTDLFSNLKSTGYEMELVANLTPQWRLALNASKSEAIASDIGASWIRFITERSKVWAENSTLTGPEATNTTIGSRYLSIISVLNQMAESDGQRVESARDWRANLVTRYSVSSGRFKGAFVGGGYRWRSPQVLGYKSSLVENKFKLPGAPDLVLVPARDAPIKGKTLTDTELFIGYTHRFAKRLNWRIQLNVRNVFDNQDAVPSRANLQHAFVSVYSIPDPRSFILTNTVEF